MKSKILLILFLLIPQISLSENFNIQAENISINKQNEISIFENKVLIQDEDFNSISSDYAEFDKKNQFLTIKKNVKAIDKFNNILIGEELQYDLNSKIITSVGEIKIVTEDGYTIITKNIILDNINHFIKSENKTKVVDIDKNKIYLENFEYLSKQSIIKSVGLIKVFDNKNNSYEFSQIYIDKKKKEIIGADIKAFLNEKSFKTHNNNKPRVFANTVDIKDSKTTFKNNVFTLCDYRKNDKCPPWTLQSKEMLHDNEKKTIYYKNALIKIYDVPILYMPYLSHPDPTVDRRSGFLPPRFMNTKNLGNSISVPYYFAIDKDKDFTLTNRLIAREHPIFLGEYRQEFKSSNLLVDAGHTEGYKNTSTLKKGGDKSHFFTKFTKNFTGRNNSDNFFSFNLESASDDKYLKLYKVKSLLTDYNKDVLESSINFSHQNEDLFLGVNSSLYKSLKEDYNDKYEYILPSITLDKNLFSGSDLGSMDIQSNFQIHNYDTNKTEKFLVNDFTWDIKDVNFRSSLQGKWLANFKNTNYETKNISEYKSDTTSELFGAIGYLSKINLYKDGNNGNLHYLTPKILTRFSPEHMRKAKDGSKLNTLNAFKLNRLNNSNNFEGGLNATLGFDYSLIDSAQDEKVKISMAQIINEKENKKMPSISSLDEKLSDLAGKMTINTYKDLNINYNFLVDQNYKDLNYNEMGIDYSNEMLKFDLSYIKEDKHVGDEEYVKTDLKYMYNDKASFSFKNKRNIKTDSSEYYDLSYEYLNDCLRAGLVYRREFYNDSELEPENSLMFKITLIPFGNINSPSLN
jgi:LPS-assembly protein